MKYDWRSIPGNKFTFKRLCDLLAGLKAVSFVGAGASAGLYPLWNDLIQQLAEEAAKQGLVDHATRQAWIRDARTQPDYVVQSIKRALGVGIYSESLRRIFRTRKGDDGNRYTPLHGLLVRLPFRGHITTNFDSGLVEARHALRPDSLGTGFGTWNDKDTVEGWSTNSIFDDQPCPILFAHGIYDRSDTVVLAQEEFHLAYRNGPFRRLFLNLWGQANLVFVGFSFNDEWIRFIAHEVLGEPSHSEPRHVALIGLRDGEQYSKYERDRFTDQYNAYPLFYPVISNPGRGPDHSVLRQVLEEISRNIGETSTGSPNENPAASLSGKMPTTRPQFVGREEELEWLDAAWSNPNVGIASLIASGGVGKSTLALKWSLRLAQRMPNLVRREWSFYNQGTTAGSQGDAESFFTVAFNEWFKIARPGSRWEQGRLIAQCICKSGTLLLLDGLEPLQRLLEPNQGSFYDERMIALLQGLAAPSDALCVCTSRLPLTDLDGHNGYGYLSRILENLTPASGAELFQQYQIQGSNEELRNASTSIGGHALSLTLVARYIAECYSDRHIHHIDSIPSLASLPIDKQGNHARRILSHYETVFPTGSVESALLRCLGLFDRPAQPEALDALWRQPEIDGLTTFLRGTSVRDKIKSLRKLDKLGLVSFDELSKPLDCHPIIRAHFADLLIADQDAWRPANLRLSRYYAALPLDEQPSSLEEMQPLYPAVTHAGKANAFAEGWEIYWNRIQQGHPKYFNTNVLGAFHEGLASLSSFFNPRWEGVAQGVEEALTHADYLRLLTEVGFHLKVLGRFDEAKNVIRTAIETYDKDNNFVQAAINSENLSEADLLNGNLNAAASEVELGRDGVCFAEMSLEPFRRLQTLALRGQILFYLGKTEQADLAFFESEKLRLELCPQRQPVRSLYILDFLAEAGRFSELEMIANRFRPLLDETGAVPFTGSFYLFEGQAKAMRAFHEYDGSLAEEALGTLHEAVRLLDAAELPHLKPWARCVRARLLVHLGDKAQSKNDLDTGFAIAKYSNLKLFEIECHLGLCNYHLAFGSPKAARSHLEEAKRGIVARNYRRPRTWLASMERKLQGSSLATEADARDLS